MNFGEIVDRVLDLSGQGSGGAFEKLVKFGINAAYLRVLDTGLIPHEHREFTLASVADTSQYGLPLYVRKVLNLEDPTNDISLWTTSARQYDQSYPGTSDSGTPRLSYSLGTRGVEKFPASDGTLSLVSDDTGDDGSNYKVRVTGFNTSGVLVTEQVTMDGTTAATTTNSYDSTLGIERIAKEPAEGITFSGNITVKDDDSNTISIVPIWWDSPDYVWIEFHPIPSAVITYTVRVEMRKPPLVNDGDWPEFDQEFHDLLVWGTTQELLPAFGKSPVADRHRASFDQRLKDFRREKDATPNAVWTFSNVQNRAGYGQRPHRPLIPGVDVGLGTAT
ncbi:hypothetical protein CMI37_37480 [Candidatus Pacearchaeota archaeon]|nr:hypothetical protein [Candidatus Pacearchaeota archaeon]